MCHSTWLNASSDDSGFTQDGPALDDYIAMKEPRVRLPTLLVCPRLFFSSPKMINPYFSL